ncbi:hypothetical protein [Flammeovirga kamogawensis]|uniref:Lipocalin-like domain-containing protein n=1 Tax=Flammeovirga kamogawensis TaxID=373891 RepID=A0ABX8GZ04_9BACT|nr:hypothetical protein [Flammeovirga kamogawensis]MBB6459288.1 hypothetical protein [Flammeovirga kamogawensis]QWG08848.1 hypothetical protein KM029_07875 [Flammeovirga kamogawensis]TRX67138.1 hypothetical protein EO216_02920 [Flammeovirga kamogawensis]
MRYAIKYLLLCFLFFNCSPEQKSEALSSKIEGTWKLISAKTIVGKDTTVKDFTKDIDGIKIIGKSHFSFFQHDKLKGEGDNAKFSAGAGIYKLDGNKYTEHLEYCTGRKWEDNTFEFTLEIQNDSLYQIGREKIPELNVDRIIIEKYVLISTETTQNQI